MSTARIRHLVLMADDLQPVGQALRAALGVGDPFSDPIAGEFGLRNEIYNLGDQFVEVCEPVSAGAPGRRHLDRFGESGYQVIFQVPGLAAARARVDAMGVRVIWEGEREGIAGMHLHPRDLPGSIVSMDMATPPEQWPWGGPAWTGRTDAGAPPGAFVGVTVSVAAPEQGAATWARALGLEADGTTIAVGDQTVTFVDETASNRHGLIGVDVVAPGADAADADICGVRFAVRPSR